MTSQSAVIILMTALGVMAVSVVLHREHEEKPVPVLVYDERGNRVP